MSDSILLRKMTRKSILGFGYVDVRDLSIDQILTMRRHKILISAYYQLGKVSFIEDILIELGITKELRIEKPGKLDFDSSSVYIKKAMRNVYSKMSEKEVIHSEYVAKVRKRVSKDEKIKSISKNSRKSILQSKNQGK